MNGVPPTGLADVVGVPRSVVAQLIADLTAQGRTVAAAESLSGGLFTALLTEIPGSSAVVRGGFVVYATDLKHTLAGVDASLLAEHGAVHPDVAVALAAGARRRCGAHFGVGLTGVAGPDPQDGRPPGTFYVALAGPAGTPPMVVAGEPDDRGPTRADVRAAAVRTALRLLNDAIATSP